MDKQNNDKWLDEIISRTINTQKPQFDAEKFKRKFPDELQELESRASKPNVYQIYWAGIFKNPIARLATAAVIILTVGLFVFFSGLKDNTKPPKVQNVEKLPGELLTSTALLDAYLNGGMEAFDEQNRKAVRMLSQKHDEITIHELLSENNRI